MQRCNRLVGCFYAALAAALCLAGAGPAVAVAPDPTPVDLGVPEGYVISEPTAINAVGQVVGWCSGAADQAPFIWENGTISTLPLPAGYAAGAAVDINSAGQVVGTCWNWWLNPDPEDGGWEEIDHQACLWERGPSGWTPTLLGFPGAKDQSEAIAINDAGQVYARTRGLVEGSIVEGSAVWNSGLWTELEDAGGGLSPLEYRPQMNEMGQVLARSPSTGALVLWSNGNAEVILSQYVNEPIMDNLGRVVGALSAAYGVPATAYIYHSDTGVLQTATLRVFEWLAGINDTGQTLLWEYLGYEAGTNLKIGGLPLGGDSTLLGWLDGEIRADDPPYFNANGEVSGNFTYPDSAFYANADLGVVVLSGLQGDAFLDRAQVRDMNASGVIVGISRTAGGDTHAVMWGEVQPINQPPALTVPASLQRELGIPVTFRAEAFDPNEGDTLTFSLSGAPAGAAMDLATGVFYWMPDMEGTFPFDVTVTDAGGLSDTKQVTVTVLPAGTSGATCIGVLPGYTQSQATAINAAGQVMGACYNTNPEWDGRAFLWLPEPAYGLTAGMHDLGALDGFQTISPIAINDKGQVTGFCEAPGDSTAAFVWLPEPAYGLAAGMHAVPLGANSVGFVDDINNAGQVVGNSISRQWIGDEVEGHWEYGSRCGYIWQIGASSVTELRMSPTDDTPVQVDGATGRCLNESGQVIGRVEAYRDPADEYPVERAVLWQNGTATILTGAVGDGWAYSAPVAINARGEVVGRYGEANDVFLWLPEVTDELTAGCHLLAAEAGRPVPNQIFAFDINDSGQIVGHSSKGSHMVPDPADPEGEGTRVDDPGALWIWENGAFRDLATFNASAEEFRVNASGQASGFSSEMLFDENGNWLGQVWEGYFWSDATGLQTLDTLGGTWIQVRGISDAGQVVGSSTVEDETATYACIWGEPAPPTNHPPVLNDVPASATIDELALYTFTATATDEDGDALTFSLTDAPFGAAIHPTTGVFTWTPAEDQGPFTFPFTVSVNDGTYTTSQTVTLTVNEVNLPPDLIDPGGQTVHEGEWLSFQLQVDDADVPGQTMAFSLTSYPEGMEFDPDTGLIFWMPTEGQGPGDYPVTAEVSDGLATDSVTFSVHVDEINQDPVLTVPSSRSGVVGTPITFQASASDPDLPANTLVFSLEDGAPAGATIDPSSGAFSWTPTAAGTVTLYVTVQDGQDGSDTEPVTITVAEKPSSALTIAVTGISRNRKTGITTVKATITNPGTTAATDTALTAATLAGISTTTSLPLNIGTMKPRAKKNISLQFPGVAQGAATLTITGTSSLGSISFSQGVTVP